MASIRTFKIFLAVVRNGTFAAAGNEIGLTAAAVGLQMRTLEIELGFELFDRAPRSVVLNTTGRSIVAEIEELIARYEALTADRDGGELSGTVVMGALVSALMGSFADTLWWLKRDHPRLRVKLYSGMSSDFARKVEHGELDAAIVAQAPRQLPASLIWTPLYVEPMVLIVPRRPHFELPKNAIDMLAKSPFIRFDRNTWTGDLVKDVLGQCNVTARDEMELNSVEAIVEIVRQGFGISVVPKLANVNWRSDRALSVIPLPGVRVDRRVGLLERTRHGRMRFTSAIKNYFFEGAIDRKVTSALSMRPARPR